QLNEKSLDLALGGLSAAVERQLRQSLSYSLRPLVNATGGILHTNLGRLRVDKLTYAALEATLLAYVKRDHDAVPVLRMMRLSKDEIARRAEKIVSQVESAPGQSAHLKLELRDGESVIGGGAAPSAVLPTRLIALTHIDLSADEINARLRAHVPSIVARVEDGRVLLDLRTVFPEQDANLAQALA